LKNGYLKQHFKFHRLFHKAVEKPVENFKSRVKWKAKECGFNVFHHLAQSNA
jgi:hypothetical protein